MEHLFRRTVDSITGRGQWRHDGPATLVVFGRGLPHVVLDLVPAYSKDLTDPLAGQERQFPDPFGEGILLAQDLPKLADLLAGEVSITRGLDLQRRLRTGDRIAN